MILHPFLHAFWCRHTEQCQAIGQHLAGGSGQTQTSQLEGVVVDTYTFGVVPGVAFWLRDCAADFHTWYNAERVRVDDHALKLARLRLAAATSHVLANGLALLGVSAPERM